MSEQDLMRVIREIYASLDGEAAKEMHEANMCITSRHVDKDGADEHKQKYHGWRRAAARVQHICLAHGIDPKSGDQDD